MQTKQKKSLHGTGLGGRLKATSGFLKALDNISVA